MPESTWRPWSAGRRMSGRPANVATRHLRHQKLTPRTTTRAALRRIDVTIERVATLLATAAPKGLLITRDELAGWLYGMTAYNEAGRQFWLEAFGGRPYRVERRKHPKPIDVSHLVVAVFGGTQPDRLADLMRSPDDGLLARFLWFWPDPLPFDRSKTAPNVDWAISALDKLRLLELAQASEPSAAPGPSMCRSRIAHGRSWSNSAATCRTGRDAGGLMRSALGKARGLALRLGSILEFLWWSGGDGMAGPPKAISEKAFAAAAHLVADYLFSDGRTRPRRRGMPGGRPGCRDARAVESKAATRGSSRPHAAAGSPTSGPEYGRGHPPSGWRADRSRLVDAAARGRGR